MKKNRVLIILVASGIIVAAALGCRLMSFVDEGTGSTPESPDIKSAAINSFDCIAARLVKFPGLSLLFHPDTGDNSFDIDEIANTELIESAYCDKKQFSEYLRSEKDALLLENESVVPFKVTDTGIVWIPLCFTFDFDKNCNTYMHIKGNLRLNAGNKFDAILKEGTVYIDVYDLTIGEIIGENEALFVHESEADSGIYEKKLNNSVMVALNKGHEYALIVNLRAKKVKGDLNTVSDGYYDPENNLGLKNLSVSVEML